MLSTIDIRFYISIVLRRLPYAVPLAVLIAATGISVALVLPPVYIARATLAVEGQQIPDELVATTVDVSATEQIQVIEQRLMTRANLLDLAERFEVFKDTPELTASEIVRDMREKTDFNIVRRGRGREAGLITFAISFSSDDPDLAAKVVDEMVDLVLDENVRLRTGRATDTLNYFEAEVDRLGGILDQISSQILEFKNANQESLPESLEFRRSEQARLQERILQLEREETGLRDTRARIVALYERTGRVDGERALTPEEAELENLRSELEQQRVLFSETNPRIVLLRNRVAALERIVAQQRVALSENEEVVELSELDLQLEQIDGRLGFIADEQGRLQAGLDRISESILATPRNEMALSAMERRYENVQQQYNAAVASLATAATGERLESLAKGERFTVIEPAVPPAWPDSPNRKLLAAASVALGGAAGMALIVLLELLNSSIRRPQDITNALGIQTFATVPYVRTRHERGMKRAVVTAAVLVFVTAIPAAIWATHTFYMPLDLLIASVADRIGLGPFVAALL